MAKYTTEVRSICETYAGLTESEGWNSVDEIIEMSYTKVFDVDSITLFDDNYKSGLFKKILLHYYTREIGYETVGIWKMKLNQKMREIIPYYNQLYESARVEYDPLKNVDFTDTHAGSFENDKLEHSTTHDDGKQDVMLKHKETTTYADRNNQVDNEHSRDGSAWTLFSDTPQGGINGIDNANSPSLTDNGYLTNATHVTDTPSYVGTKNTVGTEGDTLEYNKGDKNNNDYKDTTDTDNLRTYNKDKDNHKGWDVYTNKETGKIGNETYQEMILKWRETFLNIDMMIINELSDLFMKVW